MIRSTLTILTLFLTFGVGFHGVGSAEETSGQEEKPSRSGIVLLPVFFYTPETKIAGGCLLDYFFREPGSADDSRPSTLMPSVIYTQRKQISAEVSADLYHANERDHLEGYACFARMPDKFFGIGNTTDEDSEEDYTPRYLTFQLTLEKRLRPGLYLGLGYELRQNEILEFEEGGLLDSGTIEGSAEGRASGAKVRLTWDTRDNVFSTRRGGFCRLSYSSFGRLLGSDHDFDRFVLDARGFLTGAWSHTVAFQGYMNVTAGSVPFYMMPRLGGRERMRGYYEGRFRDKSMITVQGEYRVPLWSRFSLATFAGAGQVAEGPDAFALRDFKYSFGGGVRFALSRQEGINVRCDVGLGEETSGVYLTIGEAF